MDSRVTQRVPIRNDKKVPEIISNYIELHICRMSGEKREYLLLKRSDKNRVYPNLWQMITGGIEIGERTIDTVRRELEEETGITEARILVIPRVNTFYLSFLDKICLSPVFLAITEQSNVRVSDEHSEYKWVSFDEAKEMIHWPNQVESLEIIEKHISDEVLFNKLVEIK